MSIFPEPLFLQGGKDKVFALYLPPHGTAKGSLLYVPPFAEEMNRCRHVVAQQARKLSEQGYACLLLDPYGTGDSAGDFTEASWSTWTRDIDCAADWLARKTGNNIILWGLRLGALLAADVANANPSRFSRLLLWQPVLDGKLFLTQYLRLRVAFLMDNNLPPETTEEMRQFFKNGETLEVAGYCLSNPLMAELDEKRLSNLTELNNIRVDWFEHVSEAGKPASIASKRAIEKLKALDSEINLHTFTGPPMWQLHKRDEIPDLITQTSALFKGTP